MRKDKFLKEFQNAGIDEITVYLKNAGNKKIRYTLIFTFGDEIRKICKLSSKEFLKEFMDNICYKLSKKNIIQTKNSTIENNLEYYEIKTEDDNMILLISESTLDNEFYNQAIKYMNNKKSEYVLENFNNSIKEDKIESLNIRETSEDDFYSLNEGKFEYYVSTKSTTNIREIENICIMLANFVNKFKGELSDIKRYYMSDTKECFKVEIILGKSILSFNSHNSKCENKSDIRKIVITGKELVKALEPKFDEIESVIKKNKKLKLESE